MPMSCEFGMHVQYPMKNIIHPTSEAHPSMLPTSAVLVPPTSLPSRHAKLLEYPSLSKTRFDAIVRALPLSGQTTGGEKGHGNALPSLGSGGSK